MATIIAIIVVAVLLLIGILSSMRVVQQYEKGLVMRFGKRVRELEPGFRLVWPFGIDLVLKVDLRVKVVEVQNQDIITKDSVPVALDAVIYYKVVDPTKALLDVEDYAEATETVAQTILRSNLGAHTMQEMLTEQDKLDSLLRVELDKATEPWGIQVTGVQIRSMDLPEGLKRAMAKEAEAERERKAKVIAAQGEYESAEKLAQAAKVISEQPGAMQLRQLQTMTEIAAEKNSTILVPYEAIGFASALAVKQQEVE